MAQQKVSFKKWWKNITGSKADKGLFNIDLVDSIAYAGVPVSYTIGTQTRCQGYIPTIVSKCGWFLKEQATRTRGIFRVSGSAKRVAELQLIFDTPPNYGSQLDWSGYTIHDASNVLRRYLNHLPDPVIPLEYYEKFRDVHRNLTDEEEMTSAYQDLISKLSLPHAWLLMYLLDLLSLFAHHSAENLMDSKNLASVFQPGVLSHPNHAMSPGEYMTSAGVLKFLIEHQSGFTLPKTSYDEDDEDLAHFGLAGAAIQNFPNHQRQSIGSGLHGGYVNAEDHERLYDSRTGKTVGFEAEDGLRSLDSGIRRQLSLQKPIIPHSTLPGHTPQRSKSTNSSTSSHRSHQSSIFSSTFLAKRRSNRASKTASRIGQDFESQPSSEQSKEQDLADISEATMFGDEHARSLTPRSASLRKAQTAQLASEDPNVDFSSYLALRRRLQSEGLSREPSIFCQTIEIQFPAPLVDVDRPATFKPSPPVSTRSSPASSHVEQQQRMSQNLPRDLNLSTTAHLHIPDPPIRTRDGGFQSQAGGIRGGAALKRSSGLAAPGQNSSNIGVPILRAKSNPGEMTHVSARNQSKAAAATGSHSSGGGGHHAMEKFKGLFTGRQKDHDVNISEQESKESRRDSKRESVTEKQRKYKSQDVASSHLQPDQRAGSWRGTPLPGGIDERQYFGSSGAYIQPPPPMPHHQQPANVPPRPRPPPPEGSLMDFLDTPQRPGRQSGHSTPSAGSRSGSPSAQHSPYLRHQLPTNPSFTSTSSPRSTPTGERLYHGRNLSSQGSFASLEGMNVPGNRLSFLLSNDQPSHEDQYLRHHQQQQQNHVSPHGSFGQLGSQVGYNVIGGSSSDALVPPPSSGTRSRNGSFGSTDSYDPSAPPIAPKSRERRIAREGSTSSLRGGDVTPPPRTRSNSSRNPSPVQSPSMTQYPSGQFQQQQQLGQQQQHSPQPQHQHYQHPGSSPLAGRSSSGFGSTLGSTPSSRVRARAQSREDILRQLEPSSGSNSGRGYENIRQSSSRSLRSGSMTRSTGPMPATTSSISSSSMSPNPNLSQPARNSPPSG